MGNNTMTIPDKIQFVNELIESVRHDIIKKIERSNIPDEWDGIELRQYMADRFNDVVISGTMSRTRKREYNNSVLINNL